MRPYIRRPYIRSDWQSRCGEVGDSLYRCRPSGTQLGESVDFPYRGSKTGSGFPEVALRHSGTHAVHPISPIFLEPVSPLALVNSSCACLLIPTERPLPPRGAAGSEVDGALTLSDVSFQGTWARSAAENASIDYNSGTKSQIFKLGSSRFARRY